MSDLEEIETCINLAFRYQKTPQVFGLIKKSMEIIHKWVKEKTEPNLARKYHACVVCGNTWWDTEDHYTHCWVPEFNRIFK